MVATYQDIRELADRTRFYVVDMKHDESVILDQLVSRTSTGARNLERAAEDLEHLVDDDTVNTYTFAINNLLTSLNETILSTFRYSALQLGKENHIRYDGKSKSHKIDIEAYLEDIRANHPELAKIFDTDSRLKVRELRNGSAHMDVDVGISEDGTIAQTPRDSYMQSLFSIDDIFGEGSVMSDSEIPDAPISKRRQHLRYRAISPVKVYLVSESHVDELKAAGQEEGRLPTFEEILRGKYQLNREKRDGMMSETGTRYAGEHTPRIATNPNIVSQIANQRVLTGELMTLAHDVLRMTEGAIVYGFSEGLKETRY